jgi:hypothetical protein
MDIIQPSEGWGTGSIPVEATKFEFQVGIFGRSSLEEAGCDAHLRSCKLRSSPASSNEPRLESSALKFEFGSLDKSAARRNVGFASFQEIPQRGIITGDRIFCSPRMPAAHPVSTPYPPRMHPPRMPRAFGEKS